MPASTAQELTFRGVDPIGAPHALAEGLVQSATNVDFSAQPGAAAVRRGCTRHAAVSSAAIKTIYRHYSNAFSIDDSPFYVSDAGGVTYRGTGTSYAAIGTGDGIDRVGYGAYHTYAYIANGTKHWKDDGTTTTEWIKQVPGAPTITGPATATAFVVGTYTCAEGTLIASTSGDGTATSDATTNRIEFRSSDLLSTNLSTNTALGNIGAYGSDFIDISFSNPSVVTKVSWDYSIGGTSFTSYWHTEADRTVNVSGSLDPSVMIDGVRGEDMDTVLAAINAARNNSTTVVAHLPAAADSLSAWGVPRTQWELVGPATLTGGSDLWSNIQAIRVVVESTEPITVIISDARITGGDGWPLNDPNFGYTYWQTWATVDAGGNVVAESAPSSASSAVKCQFAKVQLTLNTNPTGTTHGLTHSILYRQGGLLPTPYAVGTYTLTTASIFDSTSDISLLIANRPMRSNIWAPANWPGDVVDISDPYYDRLFVGFENKIAWTLPGEPHTFPQTSETVVSHGGDDVQKLLIWDRLVIINRDSVYEMGGDIFEGAQANWVLQRSGSRRGSKAPRTIIKTTYGIPLLDYDGISMYLPGRGVDAPLDWAMEKMSDAFKGTATTDPAAAKGGRIPAINKSYIRHSVAAFADEKLYLGCPTGTSSNPNTLFVVDFRSKGVWHYSYPFSFTSLFWDFVDNRLLAGTTNGKIMRLEDGQYDTTTDIVPAAAAITWKIKTRAWTTPSDTVLENISLEYAGSAGTLSAYYDGGTAVALGTFTSSAKDWFISPLNGTIANNVVFELAGTQGAIGTGGTIEQQCHLHSIRFDALVEPQRVRYWRTEHTLKEAEQLWDVHYSDLDIIGTGTVLGVVFVDNTAVMTRTLIGPTGGRKRTPQAFPAETYGHVAYTTYTATGTLVFKHWESSYASRPEPPRINYWKTEPYYGKCEEWFQRVHSVVNPFGTLLGTVVIDNTAVSTITLTGTKQISLPHALPSETYGKMAYVEYNGTGFKHYATYFDTTPEPDRVRFYESPTTALPSENYTKTWLAEVNPLGNTVTANVYLDGALVMSTILTGSVRMVYELTLPLITSGKTLKATYTSSGNFKHYSTNWEFEAKPFGKTSWLVTYRKVGGATQLDMARFSSLDVEGTNTYTLTSTWEIDGTAFSTSTQTFTGRQYRDRISFPPGARGYIFQQRITSTTPIKVWRSNLDIERVGVKGFSRVSFAGTPHE